MKIKDWVIVGLLVAICSVLVVVRGKATGTEDASSTLQDMNIDELMRKIEDASSTLQDMNNDVLLRRNEDASSAVQNINLDELMRKRVEERLKQIHVKGGFRLWDITLEEIADSLTDFSRGYYGREWGVEFRAGGSGAEQGEKLPTSMQVREDISLYEVLCRLVETTDIEFIIEPEGVILCREWDK